MDLFVRFSGLDKGDGIGLFPSFLRKARPGERRKTRKQPPEPGREL
jgi:hypothetical protein